jgi:tetratricopeptide (TPR) repeat protein
MNKVPKADLQRWSEEVARDPAAPAFIPLAQSYRRRGQLDAAIQLCVRALARHPAHIDGHALLAQLYLELGDHERAGDEWSIVLRLDPDHFEAHRGLGFFWLERGRHEDAERHLVEAAAIRPDDAAVLGALALIDGGSARDEEVGSAPGPLGGGKGADGEGEVAAPPPPGQVFESLLKDPACNGALVLDAHGLVLAGGLRKGV